MYNRLIEMLTDNYKKHKDSNIGKLFLVITDELEEIKHNLGKTEDYRDVDIATGRTLDKIGGNVKQYRGISTDEIYRLLIKNKLRSISSSGDLNTIISIMSDALIFDPSEIGIEELYANTEGDKEPAALRILSVPLRRLAEIGLSSQQFIEIIESSIPAGVRIAELTLEGTFEFSDRPNDMDDLKGFGSHANPAIGGQFGATYKSGQDQTLPI